MKWLGIVIALIVGAPLLYSVAYPSLTLRYRLSLEAEVDGKPKTGSGVIEVTYSKQPEFASGRDRVSSHRGEAVMLDLGDRGTLFALLQAGSDSRSIPESIVLRAFNFDGGAFPGPTVEEGFKKLRQLSGKRDLPLDNLPMLVRFRDINDPKTVERVSPLNIGERFGPNAKLVRATLEIAPVGIWPLNSFGITGEPVTNYVKTKLNWLPNYYDRRLDGQRFGMASSSLPLANELSSGAFSAGL
ncbi:hypothetical protein IVB30_22140 [Bradyrhizobium sp. 200]|uniref:hypothetical protein n=1 Tax=Bradyrhizobium sp. 200 TaxID=2782665 RepID=UPI001FFFD053|nr:hypothetical protein [Bradyrhizobium sp. 200]UPJ53770.1 hypothetical protein IVB30_22140 [Bradyrhizobium sp. 200]